MKNRLVFFFIFFIVPMSYVNGQTIQNIIESTKHRVALAKDADKVLALDSLSRLYWDLAPDSSLMYSLQAVEIAQKLKNQFLQGEAYNSLGNAYLGVNEPEKALFNYQKSKAYRENLGNKLSVAKSLNNIALSYIDLGRYTEAITSYKEAADLCEEIEDFIFQAAIFQGVAQVYLTLHESNKALENAIKAANTYIHFKNKSGLASVYNFIGSLHRNLNNQSLALEYYLKAHEFYTELDDIDGLTTTTNNLGIVYDELNDKSKAMDYYQKSMELAERTGRKKGVATALNNIGLLHTNKNEFAKAKEAYEKSIKISIGIRDISSIMNTYNNIALLQLKAGDVEGATHSVTQALKLKDKVSNLVFIAESHELMGQIMEKKGQLKEALYHKTNLLRLKDSIYNKERTQQVIETQMRFETERKDREIQLLKKDNAINELLIQKQSYTQRFLIAISIMLVAFSLLFYNNFRTKKATNNQLTKSNELLEATNKRLKESESNLKTLNATKDKFFSIIAHDLKNPFTAIMGFGEILYKNFESFSEDEKKQYIKIIYESSVNLYRLLENLLHWSKSQLGTMNIKPELIPVQPIVNNEIQTLDLLIQKKGLKLNSRIDINTMVYADKNSVSIIVRNLLGNAIKFTQENGKISITANEMNSGVEISVTDSGVGMDQSDIDNLFSLTAAFSTQGTDNEEGTGLGLLLCKDLAEKNEGSIKVHSVKGVGSTFTITLPTNRWS